MTALDPRVNAWRPDLADVRLRGRVEATRFVEGRVREVATSVTALRRHPHADAPRETELLAGERVAVFEEKNGWCWLQADADGYVGYAEAAALRIRGPVATHKVCAVRTFVFAEPDIKSPVVTWLSLCSPVAVVGETARFAELASGGFIARAHLMAAGAVLPDPAATARLFLETPYLWGGRSSLGIDCSALVQLALTAAGISCPRDTDMQEKSLGEAVDPDGPLRRGDLAFWKGHVGILTDAATLLHANATHMKVAEEPLEPAIRRIAETDGPLTSVRRLPGLKTA